MFFDAFPAHIDTPARQCKRIADLGLVSISAGFPVANIYYLGKL
jgi:hypothetical protein